MNANLLASRFANKSRTRLSAVHPHTRATSQRAHIPSSQRQRTRKNQTAKKDCLSSHDSAVNHTDLTMRAFYKPRRETTARRHTGDPHPTNRTHVLWRVCVCLCVNTPECPRETCDARLYGSLCLCVCVLARLFLFCRLCLFVPYLLHRKRQHFRIRLDAVEETMVNGVAARCNTGRLHQTAPPRNEATSAGRLASPPPPVPCAI